MNKGPLYTYRKEILDFLRTVTIKFTPFCYILGGDYIARTGVTEIATDRDNPYYLQLCGYYDTSAIQLEIYSLEEQKYVTLTREYLETHPKTRAVYKIPNVEYDTLLSRYPEHSGLINQIIYPVSDIDTVLAAPDLSVLYSDTSLLHPGEVS